MTTHLLSVSHRGVISLFVVNVAIMNQVSAFCSGSLPYMVNQKPVGNLFLISYLWNFVSAPVTFLALYFFDEIESGYGLLILLSGLFQGLFAVNQSILLGKQKFKFYNFSQICLQAFTLVLFVCFLYVPDLFNIDQPFHFRYYLFAYTVAVFAIWLIGFLKIITLTRGPYRFNIQTFISLIKYGFLIQTGAFAQQLNNRMSYYFLSSNYAVGIFSTGLSIIEKLMVISRGFSTIQYPVIAESKDQAYAVELTKSFAKMTLLLTCIVASIALFIPDSVYEMVVGSNYANIKDIVVALAPAIVLLSISNILSHYFSGLGLFHHNTIGSIAGLIITLGVGVWAVPEYGIIGAIVTTNLSYFVLVVYQLVIFYRQTPFRIQDWLVTREDWQNLFKGKLH